MNSEGKLFVPKPIRKCATALPLIHSKSIIGCPYSKANNDNSKNANKNNNKRKQNSLFGDIAKDFTHQKPSKLSIPDDKLSFGSYNELEKKTIVSYKEFQRGIDNEFAKQSATFEILSILSNSKNCLRELNYQSNFNSDFNKFSTDNDKKTLNSNGSLSGLDLINSEDKMQERLDECSFNPNKNLEEDVKSSYARDPELDKYTYNPFDSKKENLNLSENPVCQDNLSKNHSENGECFRQENLNKNKNLFLDDQGDIIINSTSNNKKPNELGSLVIDGSSFPPLKKEKKALYSNFKNDSSTKNFSNPYFKEPQTQNPPNANNINEFINKEKQKKEKVDFLTLSAYDSTNNNDNLLKKISSKTACFPNNILYFIEENFFLELQNEKLENFYFTTSLNKSNNQNFNTEDNPKNVFKSSVPIRCKNPFLKSLKNEGLNKINNFFNCGKTDKDDNLPSYEESIETLFYSEKTKFQVKRINVCKM